ncbi:endonuclease/exonuclease/phosphatase family protein [Tsukamurella serpentis]
MKILVRPVVSILGTVALLGAVLVLALHFWPGGQAVPVAAAAFVPVLLVAALALSAVCLLYVRALLRLVLVVVVAAAGFWMQSPLWRGEAPPAGPTLNVLTSNLQIGEGDAGELAKLVRESRIDVLAVQEITPEAAQQVRQSTIAADLPYEFVRAKPGAAGTAIYSRFPLSGTAAVPGFVLEGLSAVVSVPGRGEVQLFALHPLPPLDVDIWEQELRRIEALLQGVPQGRPVIALGDYNATYDHVQFRRLLSGGYRDAGQLAGAGWLPTYPTDKAYPPLVGIDHVLLRGLSASSVSTHEIRGADHLALAAVVG